MDFNLLLEVFLTTMLSPANFLFVLVGITAGIIVGALPGLIASFMEYCNFPVSPILPALILGPMAEQNLRRSIIISHGDPAVFFTRPISAGPDHSGCDSHNHFLSPDKEGHHAD